MIDSLLLWISGEQSANSSSAQLTGYYFSNVRCRLQTWLFYIWWLFFTDVWLNRFTEILPPPTGGLWCCSGRTDVQVSDTLRCHWNISALSKNRCQENDWSDSSWFRKIPEPLFGLTTHHHPPSPYMEPRTWTIWSLKKKKKVVKSYFNYKSNTDWAADWV